MTNAFHGPVSHGPLIIKKKSLTVVPQLGLYHSLKTNKVPNKVIYCTHKVSCLQLPYQNEHCTATVSVVMKEIIFAW